MFIEYILFLLVNIPIKFYIHKHKLQQTWTAHISLYGSIGEFRRRYIDIFVFFPRK